MPLPATDEEELLTAIRSNSADAREDFLSAGVHGVQLAPPPGIVAAQAGS